MTNKTIEANEKLAKIMAIKKELLEVFTEVEFQGTKYHTITFECDGETLVLNFNDAVRFAQDSAVKIFIAKSTGKRPDGEKAYWFKKAYQAKLVTSNKDYKKYSTAKLKEMVEQQVQIITEEEAYAILGKHIEAERLGF